MNFQRYESRFQAGQLLANFILQQPKMDLHLSNENAAFCFAIPNGGVPVAEGFCSSLKIPYDILIVRKVKIPYNPEAGFGSVTTDGTVLLNDGLLNSIHLSKEQIDRAVQITTKEIQERLMLYEKNVDLVGSYEKNIKDRIIFMMDDGLASGFTMLAAIKMIKKYGPKKLYIAVPTAPLRTVQRFTDKVDAVFCPNVREVWSFAVADAYKHWYDLTETETLDLLKKSEYYLR